MNRRRFIKTALGAMTAFLFASWRSSDEPPTDMPFVPKLGQVDRSRELIPTDVFADGLAATFNYPTSGS